jgi:hypothetical protein
MPRVKKEILPPEHCASVKEYEASDWWRAKSKKLLEPKDLVCPICGRKRWLWMPRKKKWKCIRFCSHHISYLDTPNEKPEQIMACCWQCHDLFHLLLRLEKWGGVFAELATIAKRVFFYDGTDTFHSW